MDNSTETRQAVYEADPRAPVAAPVAAPPPATPRAYDYGIPAHSTRAGLSGVDIAAGVVTILMICGPLLAGALRAG